MDKRQCAEEVWSHYGDRPCESPATKKAEGKDWCVRHSPEGKEKAEARRDERRKADDAYWQRKAEEDRERQHRYDMYPKLLAALDDIAKGMAPPEVMAQLGEESPEQFRGRMWSWSERRAREAIDEAEKDPSLPLVDSQLN